MIKMVPLDLKLENLTAFPMPSPDQLWLKSNGMKSSTHKPR